MDGTAAFSEDYATARRRFRESAARLGWGLETHPIGANGPNGEQLTIDVAFGPDTGANQTLVLSSGVHGVEGFFGSAVQIALLDQWANGSRPMPTVRCVFLHGLNPFGFAWLRRCDENNVDANRNFLLAGEPYSGSPPGYASLDRLINPKSPPSRSELVSFTAKALWTIAQRGMPALKQAIAAGQYDFPRGLFFGGAGPSRLNQLLSENLGRWLRGSRDVVHLDFHTGLGRNADCKLLIDYPLSNCQRTRLATWFGKEAFETSDSRGTAYAVRGGLGQWSVASKFAEQYLFACAEFGTYGPMRVLAGIRSENQSHHWGQPRSTATRRVKERLKELFCPNTTSWRLQVLDRSFDLVARAINGMTADRSV